MTSDPMATTRVGPVRRFFLRHPRVMDALVMAWFGIPGLGSAAILAFPGQMLDAEDLTPNLGDPAIAASLAIALVAIGTAALWWRRQRPVLVLGIETALGVLAVLVANQSLGFEYAAAFAIYALAAMRGSRAGWIGLGGAMAVLLTALIASGAALESFAMESGSVSVSSGGATSGATGPTVVAPMMMAFLLGLVVVAPSLVALAIGVSVHNRRRYVAELVDRADRLALEQQQREQLAVADERARIARELHDVVAHSLTVMITLAEGAAGIAPRDAQRAAGVMRDVAQTGRDALTDTRRVVGVLRSEPEPHPQARIGQDDGEAPLEPAPVAAIEHLVGSFRSAGLPVALARSGPDLPVDSALRLTVYRIVQEALTNVLRYAPLAVDVTVAITTEPERVEVVVANSPGPGPRPPAPGSGRGLIGMRERVAVLNGTLEAGPTPNHGWRVVAILPRKDQP